MKIKVLNKVTRENGSNQIEKPTIYKVLTVGWFLTRVK